MANCLGVQSHQHMVKVSVENCFISDYQVVIGNLHIVEKDNPFTQIADFCAFPIAKGNYDPEYRPYRLLINQNKIVFK